MAEIQGKVWGRTKRIFSATFFEMHELHILPNSFCSTHKHCFKHNAFLVISGECWIEVRKNDYALVDPTHLRPGDITSVSPNEYHWFRTGKKPCVLYEIYYCEPGGAVLAKDIIRENVGGRGRKVSKVKRK